MQQTPHTYVCQDCGLRWESAPLSNPLCPACGEAQKFLPSGVPKLGNLEIRYIEGKGLGVITTVAVPVATCVEACPVLVWEDAGVAKDIWIKPSKTTNDSLFHYLLPWKTQGTLEGARAVCLGWGMVYNHSNDPNVGYVYREDENSRYFIDYYSLKDIKAGEELVVSYAPSSMLWFDPKG